MTYLNLEDFRTPIINESDKYFNYEEGFNANYARIPLLYNQERFTGSTISNEDDFCRIVEYVEGLAEGKNCLFSKNMLISEVFYSNGYELHGKTWHENRRQESVWERYTTQTWDENGSLLYEKHVEPDTEVSEEFFYFSNGDLKFKQFTSLQICVKEYYASNQELLLTQKIYFHTSPITDEVVYNHEVLEQWYFDMLDSEYRSADMVYYPNEVNSRMHLIWMWFWEVLKINKELFIKIFAGLLLHSQKDVVQTCVQIIAYHRFLGAIQDFYVSHPDAQKADLESIFEQIKIQQMQMDTEKPTRETKKL